MAGLFYPANHFQQKNNGVIHIEMQNAKLQNRVLDNHMQTQTRFMRKIFLITVLASLTACVSPHAVLVNDEGSRVTCQATGFGIISGTMANNSYESCVSEAQMRGFKFDTQER